MLQYLVEQDVAQAIEHPPVKVSIIRSIVPAKHLLFFVSTSGPQLVHQGGSMCCPACGKVHVKDPLVLIGKNSLCHNDHMFDIQQPTT